jgi:hypothetical protein
MAGPLLRASTSCQPLAGAVCTQPRDLEALTDGPSFEL